MNQPDLEAPDLSPSHHLTQPPLLPLQLGCSTLYSAILTNTATQNQTGVMLIITKLLFSF